MNNRYILLGILAALLAILAFIASDNRSNLSINPSESSTPTVEAMPQPEVIVEVPAKN